MIQFNLLPAVKLEYIKASRTRRLVTLISVGVGGFMLLLTILLLISVFGLQKHHIHNLNNDINKYSGELKNVPDLGKILTIQNQLNSLPGLHDKKAVSSRLFGYITQLTPTQASISDLNIDFAQNKLAIKGVASSLNVINKFTDSLKFTKYSDQQGSQSLPAFPEVVLANFNRAPTGTEYQIDIKFDPIIFDSTHEIKLTVPSIISTRSETEKPKDLFQEFNNNQAQ